MRTRITQEPNSVRWRTIIEYASVHLVSAFAQMITYPNIGAGSTQQLLQSLPIQKEAHKCHVCEATNIIEDAQMSCGCRLQNLARQMVKRFMPPHFYHIAAEHSWARGG